MIVAGKTVIVSGVGDGLGRRVAAAAVRDGANVVLGARTAATLEKLAAELDTDTDTDTDTGGSDTGGGGRVAWLATDITDRRQCGALAGLALDRFGRIDGLVNCAALDSTLGGIRDTPWEDWRASVEVNLLGTMQMTEAVVAAMGEGGGSVVFVGTQATYWSQVPQVAYGASKAAILGALPHLVAELGPRRIRLNVVTPSWMWGPPVQAYVAMAAEARGVAAADVLAGITRGMPLGEMPGDGDVAEAVLFFLSDRSRMVTGQTLLVNAGEYLR